jgi:hypothetical protein
MFAVFMCCRPVSQGVDHVTGHAGGLFSALTGLSRFRQGGTVQTKFREAANCLGAADRLVLTDDPAIDAFEQAARQPNSYRSLSGFRCGRLTRRHVVLRALNSGQDISSTHEKSPAERRARPRRIRRESLGVKDLKTFSQVLLRDGYARLKHKPRDISFVILIDFAPQCAHNRRDRNANSKRPALQSNFIFDRSPPGHPLHSRRDTSGERENIWKRQLFCAGIR